MALRIFTALALLTLSAPTLAALKLVNGYWYQGGGFSAEAWYIVGGILQREFDGVATETIDLEGGFVIPPMAEAHNHNLQSPWLTRRFAPEYRAAGVFYGLMLCGDPRTAAATREALADARLDVHVAGACISSRDGHPLRMALFDEGSEAPPTPTEIYDKAYIVIDHRSDIAAKWPLIQAAGGEWAKIILVHSERHDRRADRAYFGVNGLKAQVVQPLVSFLRERGLRVAAHVDSAADFAVAVDAGVDLITHLPGYRWWPGHDASSYRLGDATIEAAARRNIPVVTTGNVATLFDYADDATWTEVRALQLSNLQRLHAAGVPLLLGSDRFDGNVLDEADYLLELGAFTPAQLLHMLVQDGPRRLFPERRIGKFKEGYEASLLVLDGNPLRDWSALRRIQRAMQLGRWVSEPTTAAIRPQTVES